MDTVNTEEKEHLDYQETPMGNVVVQCIPNCDTHLIKAGEPLQSSHTGWPRTRAFAAIALGAIGTAAEVARLLYFSFFFYFKCSGYPFGNINFTCVLEKEHETYVSQNSCKTNSITPPILEAETNEVNIKPRVCTKSSYPCVQTTR